MMATENLNDPNIATTVPAVQENAALKSVLENLNPVINIKTILDLRTVCGMDLLTAKNVFPMAQVIGITTAENRDKLRRKIADLITIDIEKDCLPFQSGTIDIILVEQTFNRVKEVYWMIHEATRALRTQGYLIVAVPQTTGQQSNFASQQAIQDFLNSGFPSGYELVPITQHKSTMLPKWVAKILNFFIREDEHSADFFVLRKTQPYSTGFLDKKINP